MVGILSIAPTSDFYPPSLKPCPLLANHASWPSQDGLGKGEELKRYKEVGT